MRSFLWQVTPQRLLDFFLNELICSDDAISFSYSLMILIYTGSLNCYDHFIITFTSRAINVERECIY